MTELEAALERWPSLSPNGTPIPGVHPEVIAPVMEHPRLGRDAVVMICRAMQRLAQQTAEMQRKDTRPTQLDLFAR